MSKRRPEPYYHGTTDLGEIHDLIGKHRFNMDDLVASAFRACYEVYQVSRRDLIGDARWQAISWPRQVVAMTIYAFSGASQPDVGRVLGGRDHTTVLHALRMTTGRMRLYEDFRAKALTLVAKTVEYAQELAASRATMAETGEQIKATASGELRVVQTIVIPEPKEHTFALINGRVVPIHGGVGEVRA